jgi:predicted phage-related endonuclease
MRVERREITDRAQWLEWREDDVTASMVAALPRFACHPYVTPLRLYVEKAGINFPNKDNKVMRRGRWLEPAVARAVAEMRPEWVLSAPNVYLRSPVHRLGATPDYLIEGDQRGVGLLQCKTVAPAGYTYDWLEGTEIPEWIELQTLTEMMLSEAAFGAVAALRVDAFNMDVAIIEVARDPVKEAAIIAAVDAFWVDVVEGNQPDPDFALDRAEITALSPRETTGKLRDLSGHNQIGEMLERRAALHARIKIDSEKCEEIENEIRFLLGEAEAATGVDGWRITNRTTAFKGYTVQPRERRVLRISPNEKKV